MNRRRLHPLEDAAAALGGRRPEYYRRLAKAGVIPARQIAGHWYFTDEDIDAALEVFKNNFTPPAPPSSGGKVRELSFTSTTARRRAAS